MSSAVVLEGWSVLLALSAVRAIRRSDVIYIARRAPLREGPEWQRRWVRRVVRWFNARACLTAIPLEIVSDQIWRRNRDAVEGAAALGPAIRASIVYAAIRRTIADDHLVRYFQAAVARRLPNPELFSVQVAHVAASHDKVIAVPAWETRLAAGPPTTGGLDRLVALLSAAAARARLMVVPVGFVARRLRYGLHLGSPRSFLVAVPVVWGAQRSEGDAVEVRRPQDDLYLYGGRLLPGSVLHVLGDWSFPEATERAYVSEFARRGLPLVDKRRFGLSLTTLRLAWIAEWHAIRLALTPWRASSLDALLLQEGAKALYYWLTKHAELAVIRYRAEIIKNDYNPGHVINTIVARRHGIVSIGVQHAASPHDAPQLAFVCFDRYIVYGDLYVRAFGTHWASMTLDRTGRESIDWVVEATSPPRRAELRRRWLARHGDRGKLVLVLFPGAHELCLRAQWDQLYEGLASLVGQPGDFIIVLRFRNAVSLRSPEVGRFATLSERDPRFVVELTDFTTYELIALSDVVIAGEASFTVNEAIAAVPVVFTFEYVGTARHYFGRYGRDFVLRTADDVRRVFESLDDGFGAFDCHWDELRRDANFHADGHNRRRLREVVEQVVSPDLVKESTVLSAAM